MTMHEPQSLALKADDGANQARCGVNARKFLTGFIFFNKSGTNRARLNKRISILHHWWKRLCANPSILSVTLEHDKVPNFFAAVHFQCSECPIVEKYASGVTFEHTVFSQFDLSSILHGSTSWRAHVASWSGTCLQAILVPVATAPETLDHCALHSKDCLQQRGWPSNGTTLKVPFSRYLEVVLHEWIDTIPATVDVMG